MGAVSVFMTGNYLRQPVDDGGPLSSPLSYLDTTFYTNPKNRTEQTYHTAFTRETGNCKTKLTHTGILTDDETLCSILPNRPTASFKRNTSLGNILVRSDIDKIVLFIFYLLSSILYTRFPTSHILVPSSFHFIHIDITEYTMSTFDIHAILFFVIFPFYQGFTSTFYIYLF